MSTTGVADRATKQTSSSTTSATTTTMSFLTSQCSTNKPGYSKDAIANQIPALPLRTPIFQPLTKWNPNHASSLFCGRVAERISGRQTQESN